MNRVEYVDELRVRGRAVAVDITYGIAGAIIDGSMDGVTFESIGSRR